MSLTKRIAQSLRVGTLVGTLVETSKGFAVETVFDCETDGNTYHNFRLVNGADGVPKAGTEVRFSGSDTWQGIGFTVATNRFPDKDLTVVEPKPTASRRKK